jgi:hypothetical protein
MTYMSVDLNVVSVMTLHAPPLFDRCPYGHLAAVHVMQHDFGEGPRLINAYLCYIYVQYINGICINMLYICI